MRAEDKACLYGVLGVLAAITLCVLSYYLTSTYEYVKAFEHGYERCVLPGRNEATWCKPK